jgi:hypothetical protein
MWDADVIYRSIEGLPAANKTILQGDHGDE